MFARLADQEQERRVDGFARMAEGELKGLDFLSGEAKGAVGQVRRALQLLACYRAVAAIHKDERFQEDAGECRRLRCRLMMLRWGLRRLNAGLKRGRAAQ